MDALQIVVLVLAILLVQVSFWVPVFRWLRRRLARLTQELRDELGEAIVEGPEPMIYRGATGGYSKVKGNGVVALTRDRLVLAKLVGDRIEVPLAEVTGLRAAKRFASSYRNGRLHVILKVGDEHEIGFMVEQHDAWMDALREHLGEEDAARVAAGG